MGYFSNEKRFEHLIENSKEITHLLEDEMVLISGDFYGIQKFIFERLSTKNAAKVIRARSAYIQLFTYYIAEYICQQLGIDNDAIISSNAGRFEILSSKCNIEESIKNIQKKIDDFFIKNFYGLSGVMISSVECKRDDFKPKENYKALRKKIIDSLEDRKFQKFNLSADTAPDMLSYDTDIDNQSLCKICNIRKKKTNDSASCEICNHFIELGKKLSTELNTEILPKNYGICIDDTCNRGLKLTKKIQSYVLRDENGEIVDFEALSKASCSQSDGGTQSLAVLKADVDNMGKFLEKSDVTDSFKNFDTFSKSIDNFFSLYISNMMKERKKYKNTYTVFAGGDDLFLIGAWDEIVALARDIHKEFNVFVKNDALSISFGMAMTKPSVPISYLAEHSEALLEEAKDIDDEKEVEHPKDAISLFGETVKWNDYLRVYTKLYGSLKKFKEHLNTAFLYRLLELIEMSKNVKYLNDIPSTMWKSKFRYSFNRNVLEKMKNADDRKKAEEILELLGGLIDTNPKETKMVVHEFIYKRRKS